jgi:AcrR family transcriptional regulator
VGEGDFDVGELARRAGVSEGLPYHYFGSKAGALSAVIDDFYDRYYGVVNQDLDLEAAWPERELQRLRAWIAFLYSEPLAPIVLGKMGRTVQVAGVEATRQDQLIGLARRNIETGQRSGEIPGTIDAGIAAAAIIGAIRQAASHAFAEAKRPDPRVLSDQLWALISGALGLGAPGSK